MRISASVEIFCRKSASLNIDKRRAEKSNLSIGFVTPQKDRIYILHQTSKNSVGVRYKILDNVTMIHDKFLNQGKATIRLIQPNVDLIIKGDSHKITKFIQIVKSVLRKESANKLQLSNLTAAPTKVINEPTKLILKGKKDFPPFPRSLEYLVLSQCSLNKFPGSILRLQKIKVLNLEDNNLEDIPTQIELLPVLQELYLAKNKLGCKSNFSWLRSASLQENLIHLDLRENHMIFAPRELFRLRKLNQLLLDKNEIKRLPPAIRNLSNLKLLSVSNNKLEWLPGCLPKMKFQMLDVSNNPWNSTPSECYSSRQKNLTLLDIAATIVERFRLVYTEETLPRTLIDYLETAGACSCGSSSFPESPNYFRPLDEFVRREVTCQMGEVPIVGFTLCSRVRKGKGYSCAHFHTLHNRGILN